MFYKTSFLVLALCGVAVSGCDQTSQTKTTPQANVSQTPPSGTLGSSSVRDDTANVTVVDVAKTKGEPLPTYIALTDPIYAPFQFNNPDGSIGGMEIEIFDAIAKDQGFQVEYIGHAWEGIFDEMLIHKRHFVVSAVTSTPEAKQKASLSDPYFSSPYRVTAIDADKLSNWKQQPRIAVSKNEDSLSELPAMGIKDAQLRPYKTVFLALTAVANNEADVVVADKTVLNYYMYDESLKAMQPSFVSRDLPLDETSEILFAVQKDNSELLNKVNTGLAHIKASGKLARILNTYHQDPAAIINRSSSVSPASSTATRLSASSVASTGSS